MENAFFASLALASSTFVLAACADNAAAPAVNEEAGIPGMSVSNARMVLAPVKGNPAAVYFDLAYDGERSVALNRAAVEGAQSAMFHEYGEYQSSVQMMDMLPLPLKAGDKVSFEPGGKHIMAMDVSEELEPGDTTEVTIIVSGGKSHSFPAEVRAAGEDR